MTKIKYADHKFRADSLALIDTCNAIVKSLQDEGYSLTLRQLYYQLVAKGIVPNSDKQYKTLGRLVSKAREAGLVSWYSIEDRTRSLKGNSHWSNPGQILRSAAAGYKKDLWVGQGFRVEVWVEKEALAGIVGQAARRMDVDYFSCRGYTSQTAMWNAGRRLREYVMDGQTPVIIHLGDHDPSGIDMTRDIADRLATYAECEISIIRAALNRDQIDLYNPPPNPAKLTDSRGRAYVREYGNQSWELDALSPSVLSALIEGEVSNYLDRDLYEETKRQQESERAELLSIADQWGE